MNLNKIIGVSLLIVSLALVSYKNDKDPLHKRKFKGMAQTLDPKDGAPKGKPFEDEIEFKNGKVYSLACWDKMELQDITYEIKKDSTYKDGEDDKRYFEIIATTTNEKKEHIAMDITIDGYDYQATYSMSKKDVVKKKFSSTATEKVKNPKKEKEKKE
jgi:hypothetical protein